ncbi:cyanase [Sandaracinus amylolyticus]|uniref:cyanase n=1 Tax=Sandaracinus amylolyticus TaxID=927083 RepID=UPI001F26F3D3|nr:cyanase [Sandaracinus amylolyticus]UJR83143.1 Hypothetical protein I5071_52090 [Sandaracinus amylolyticus]
MDKIEMSNAALAAKRAKKLTWAELSAQIGMSEVWLASVLYGEASAPPDVAKRIAEVLGLGTDLADAISVYPLKGERLGPPVPTDPLIYRFYEIVRVYGLPLKDLIQEKFGEGIMSAIDFTMHIEKVEDPKGDRVKITMEGKFLPYKRW